MGKNYEAPKGPNWKKLIKISEKAAAKNQKLLKDQLKFSKQAYEDQKAIQDDILGVQLPAMQDEASLAQTQRDRYRDQGIPFEDAYLNKIENWDTPERRDEEAGKAQSQVAQAAEASRQSAMRQMESYGIDPSQTRSAALDSKLRLAEAAMKAQAGNTARDRVEQQGVALGSDAVNLYRGMPSMAQASNSAAIQAGQAGFGNQMAMDQQRQAGFTNSANILANGYNMQQGAYGTAGNLYANDLAAHEMNLQNSPGNTFANLRGTGLGAMSGMGILAEGGPVNNRAEGGQAGPQSGGVPQGEQKPMAIPRPASQGIPPEDQTITVSTNEFVIPDDVARWEGEKSLQKLINKAREDRTLTEQQRAQNQRALGIPA